MYFFMALSAVLLIVVIILLLVCKSRKKENHRLEQTVIEVLNEKHKVVVEAELKIRALESKVQTVNETERIKEDSDKRISEVRESDSQKDSYNSAIEGFNR